LEKKKSDGKEETPAKKERVLEEWELGRVIISSNTYNTIEVTVNVKVLVKVRSSYNVASDQSLIAILLERVYTTSSEASQQVFWCLR
jgi:hypothetical protein